MSRKRRRCGRCWRSFARSTLASCRTCNSKTALATGWKIAWTSASGSASVAADVTQDVFVHLLTRAGDYAPECGALQPWLLGITRNFVHRRTGADARYVANDDDGEPPGPALDLPAPEAALDAQRDLARLRAAIAALPPHYRDVLVLVELAERSYAEAAAICGCELNTVRSRLSRARGLLARWLDAAPSRANAAKG